jgi:hypothetical protein
MYIILKICVFVCLTTFFLGPLTWYKLENGVIRSCVTWGVSLNFFCRILISGRITDKKLRHQCFFYGKNETYLFFIWNRFTGSYLIFKVSNLVNFIFYRSLNRLSLLSIIFSDNDLFGYIFLAECIWNKIRQN